MNFKFKPGEVCIFQNAEHQPELNGEECFVEGYRINQRRINPETMTAEMADGYGVEFGDGTRRFALESQLRRKEPPKTTGSIEELERLTGFHPDKVSA